MSAGAASRLGRRALDALGSRPGSVGLMAALMLYVAMLFAWTLTSPPPVVGAIARGAPFQVAYLLLAINTLACVVVFWRTVRARCAAYRLKAAAPGPLAPGLAKARRWLASRGFRVTAGAGGSLHGGRGRFSALGSPVFHLAMVLAACGALIEDRTGFSGTALVNEGQSFFGEPGEYLGLSEAAAPRAPELSFTVKSIRPEYFGDELFFTELVAEVEAPVGPGAHPHEVRLSDSTPVGQGQLTLMGFGYSLEYALRRDGGMVDEGVGNLMIFPPGQKDSLRIPGLPYTVFVELFPNFVAGPDGAPGTRGMALGDVRLGVTVLRHRAVLARRLVHPGGVVPFDGYELTLPKLVPQGQFRVRRSPGVTVLGASFLVIMAGLFLRLVWTRREALVVPAAGGGFTLELDGEWTRGAELDLRALLPGGEALR